MCRRTKSHTTGDPILPPGSWLASDGPRQSTLMPAVRPLSLASQLLQGSSPGTAFVYDPITGSLPGIEFVCAPINCRSWLASDGPRQSTLMPAVRPLSLASQLLQGSSPGTAFVYDPITGSLPGIEFVCAPINCRSWLASEGAGSVDIDASCQTAIAGKPAPTGFFARHGICVRPDHGFLAWH